MANNQGKSSKSKSAREQAAKARAAAEAQERRRQRTINLTLGLVAALLFIGIVGGAWWVSQSGDDAADGGSVDVPDVDPSAPIPTTALPSDSDYPYGVPVNEAAGKPVLEIWEDFQCPACGNFEAEAGDNIAAIAEDGDALVIQRQTTFLDRNLGTDDSVRAAAAYGCAVDAGQGEAYRRTVFANQPTVEGEGWTDEQLIGFGTDAGIAEADLPAFEACVADGTYLGWAVNSTQAFYDAEVPGTPALYLNGETLQTTVAFDLDALKAAIAAAGPAPQADDEG